MSQQPPLTPPSATVAAVLNAVRVLMASSEEQSVGLQDVVAVTRHAMQIVDTYPHLSGQEKKKVVLDVSHRLMDEIDHEYWQRAKPFVMPVVAATIDELVEAHRGKLRLRPRWRRALKFFWRRCCVCKKAK